VVGRPAHRVVVFVRLEAGGLYFITRCGMRGTTTEEPHTLGGRTGCPMCFCDELCELAA
jgi:hypothetical protein